MANGQGPAPAGSQWTAEVEVTPQFAADLIREQFPDLGAQRVTVLATGWDNTAFVVDGQWLFRFPRREIAVPGVQREITVLPRLAATLPLPIPDPQFVGQPSSRYPWPFFGARLLPGGELADSGLADSERAGAAASVGHFLRMLHDPGVVVLVDGADLPVDPMRRASAPIRARRAREVLDRLVRRGTWPADGDVSRLLDRAERGAAGAGSADGAAGATEPGGTLPAGDGLSGRGPLVVSHGRWTCRSPTSGSPEKRARTCCPHMADRSALSENWRPGPARYPWQLPSWNTRPTRDEPCSCGNASPV